MMFPKLSLLLGLAASANACDTGKSYKPEDCSSKDWQSGGRCRKIAEEIEKLQTDDGGWPKCIYKIDPDPKKNPTKDDLDFRGTVDNGATVHEIRFMAHAYAKASSNRKTFRDAAKRGIEFILNSQYEKGGWPQYKVTNKEDSYQKAITFNDGLHLNVMDLLQEIVDDAPPFNQKPFRKRADRAKIALDRGLQVIIDAQIEDPKQENGCPEKIGWCAQHDPVNLDAVGARDYEKASFSGKEGFDLAEYLMDEWIVRNQEPTDDIKNAILGAYVFAKRYVIKGCEVVRYIADKKPEENCPASAGNKEVFRGKCEKDNDDDECDKEMRKCENPDDPEDCPDLWPRFADLDETKPIFCMRGCDDPEKKDLELEFNDVPDGLNNVCDSRRSGYSWTEEKSGKDFFTKYDQWKEKLLDVKGINIKNPKSKCYRRNDDEDEALTCS